MSSSHPDSIAPWTACWQFEAAGNRPDRPEQDRIIEPVWHDFTDSMPDGARLLDLATGNGVVALCCADRARARQLNVQIDAVDAAEISPPQQASDAAPKVRFQGGVWLEELPFGDDAFDGVISQYGFEYADEEPAASEVARVLRPDGRLRLVMHAEGGAVWEDINHRQERLSGVLTDDGLLTVVRDLVRANKSGDTEALERKMKSLQPAVEAAQKLAAHPPPDDSALFFCREFLFVWSRKRQYRLDDLLRSVEDGWSFASGTAERYQQMLRVAKSAEEIDSLCNRLRSVGLDVDEVSQVCNPADGGQVAWQLDANKGSG